MSLDSHFLARAAAPGSLRWYALLFAAGRPRAALAAVLAFESELRDISAVRQDHAVAHARLQWWRTEVDRLRGRRPGHPVTQALHELDPAHDWSLLHEALTGTDLELACLSYANSQELDAYLFRSAGALQALAAELAAPGEPMREFGVATGRVLRLAEIVRDLGQDAWHGRVFVPLDALERHAAGVEALQQRQLPPAARECLRELAGQAEGAFKSLAALAAGLPPDAVRGQRVLAALHRALLREIERRDFDVGHQRLELAPLRRLWTAWLAARP